MMILLKFALAVRIVVHVRVSARIMRDAAGNLQESARLTVRKSGVIAMNAPVVRIVVHARASARIMTDVASRRLDGANETVRKGLVSMESVKEAMTILLKYALAVRIVVHVRVSARIMRDAAGNLQESARLTVKKSGVIAMNAPVVRIVVHARASARIMTDVASRRLDGANETV